MGLMVMQGKIGVWRAFGGISIFPLIVTSLPTITFPFSFIEQ